MIRADGEWLFPRYIKDGTCKATHASNALNKWLKKDFVGLTHSCLIQPHRESVRCLSGFHKGNHRRAAEEVQIEGYSSGYFGTMIPLPWELK